jgi:hypothetical protein
MNYKPMFEFASGDSLGNAQVFATKVEALGSAQDRFRVWTLPGLALTSGRSARGLVLFYASGRGNVSRGMPTGYSADETSDPVTYRWTAETGDASLPILEAA